MKPPGNLKTGCVLPFSRITLAPVSRQHNSFNQFSVVITEEVSQVALALPSVQGQPEPAEAFAQERAAERRKSLQERTEKAKARSEQRAQKAQARLEEKGKEKSRL